MLKPALAAFVMMTALTVAACDQGGQEQAQTPNADRSQSGPSATPAPQQGTTPPPSQSGTPPSNTTGGGTGGGGTTGGSGGGAGR